ncbi:MAG: proton-conducting transporter membrane subunit, partial [Gemmatimonadales bacterium]|nr:proton-conducting transporter membrane subunit [Gemmatimonadales bacterium]
LVLTVIAAVGLTTALVGAFMAMVQTDLKRVLAYSTISHLGFMMLALGAGAMGAAMFHLFAHAFAKAALFLGAGAITHGTHLTDIRKMGGLRRKMPLTALAFSVAAVSLAGIPPLAGFFSKDEILAAAFARGSEAPFWYLVWVMGVAAAALTAFYMTRLMLYTFYGTNRTGEEERTHLKESPRVMTVPLVVLAVLTVLGGALNLPHVGTLQRWLEPVTSPAASYSLELPLSVGWELALMFFAVVIAALGIWFALTRLHPERLVAADQAPAESGFAKLLLEKYRVDELYDAVIVRPVVWLSRVVLWKGVDAGAIDGAGVNGSAAVARGLGWLGSRLQTGQVNSYVLFFVLGALAVLGAMAR